MTSVIQVYDLKKKFHGFYAVKGVSFEVNKGEIFGFLGKNGAGKSTTINMLTGITTPSEGRFTILGESHTNIDLIKKKIGVMPDAANYYHDLTALAHLKFFSELKSVQYNGDDFLQLIDRVGLLGHERKKVSGFSFGMKKKLGIAQALIGDPELIFLDEPTSGLDPESALEIQQLIRSLQQKGKTIFLTSHNLQEVERLCSRVSIMEKGVITKYGVIEELKNTQRGDIIVHIQIKAISTEMETRLKLELDFCTEVSIVGTNLRCVVPTTEKIPHIIFSLARNNIEVYQVLREQKTLEDVFFED